MRRDRFRIAAAALCLALLITILPADALAAQAGSAGLLALTFDDGPGPYTEQLLDALADRGIHATFFIVGSSVSSYPDLIRRAYLQGHQIASHSFTHPTLTTKNDAEISSEISRTAAALSSAIGTSLHYAVRPPYGDCSARVLTLLNGPAIFWSIDPEDWKYRDADTVYANVMSSVSDGAIILLHDVHATSVEAAIRLVDDLTAAGYEFVTVNELYRRKGEALEDGTSHYSCPGATVAGALSAPAMTEEKTSDGIHVTLTSPDGAPVWITTDGSDPAIYGVIADGPLTLPAGTTVRAFSAFDRNGGRSETVTYILSGELTQPDPAQQQESASESEPTDPNKESWYSEAVQWVLDNGLMDKTEENTFEAERPISRGDMVDALWRMAGCPEGGAGPGFDDVEEEDTRSNAIRWAAANGIVNGYGSGVFGPEDPLTREQFSAILARYAACLTVPFTEKADLEPYRDAGEISDYAMGSMEAMVGSGMLLGTSSDTLSPQGTLTHAQIAVILQRFAPRLDAETEENEPGQPTEQSPITETENGSRTWEPGSRIIVE